MVGMDKADSFNFNPHKWMLVNFDCSGKAYLLSTYIFVIKVDTLFFCVYVELIL